MESEKESWVGWGGGGRGRPTDGGFFEEQQEQEQPSDVGFLASPIHKVGGDDVEKGVAMGLKRGGRKTTRGKTCKEKAVDDQNAKLAASGGCIGADEEVLEKGSTDVDRFYKQNAFFV